MSPKYLPRILFAFAAATAASAHAQAPAQPDAAPKSTEQLKADLVTRLIARRVLEIQGADGTAISIKRAEAERRVRQLLASEKTTEEARRELADALAKLQAARTAPESKQSLAEQRKVSDLTSAVQRAREELARAEARRAPQRLGLQNRLVIGSPALAPDEAPGTERNPLVAWDGAAQTIRETLEQLDKQVAPKILIGGDLPNPTQKFVFALAQPISLFDFLNRVCIASGLTWGFLDRDTIVVMRARAVAIQPVLPLPRPDGTLRYYLNPTWPTQPLVPRVLPAPRFGQPAPDGALRIVPGGSPENAPPDSRSFEFNGQKYYVVPLEPSPAASDDKPQPRIITVTPAR